MHILCVQLNMPSPCDRAAESIPKQYLPNPAPLKGALTPNNKLQRAVKILKGDIQGPESLAVAQDGALLLPDRHGYIWRASQTGSGQWIKDSSPLAYLGPGRPLGIRADQDGDVLVCNAGTGLQMIRGGSKEVIVLANSTTNDQGRITPISFANSLDIGPDGTIYFTDSQSFGPVLGPSFNNTDMMAICTLGILQALPHIPNVNAGTSTPLCTCMSSMYSRCSTCKQVDILLLNRLPLSLENPCRSVQVILLTHVRIWSLHAKVS